MPMAGMIHQQNSEERILAQKYLDKEELDEEKALEALHLAKSTTYIFGYFVLVHCPLFVLAACAVISGVL